jgi:hypothetical protein
MIVIINFSHPLTDEQLKQVEILTGHQVERVIDIRCQINQQQTLAPQVKALVEQCGLSPHDWQSLPLVINPPGLSTIASVLLAEIHGRCGYFPAHLRLRPVLGSVPPQYEVAEVLDLQAVREAARQSRFSPPASQTTSHSHKTCDECIQERIDEILSSSS